MYLTSAAHSLVHLVFLFFEENTRQAISPCRVVLFQSTNFCCLPLPMFMYNRLSLRALWQCRKGMPKRCRDAFSACSAMKNNA
jgi:hypothetical protein